MRHLAEQLQEYLPYNEQEKADKERMLSYLQKGKQVFCRENLEAHFTASAWITNEDKNKVLMAYHNIYNSWAWLGGHADGDTDLLHVAIKEALEESGISSVVPASSNIFSIEILTVDGHVKRSEYVSSHLHLNVTYLLKANEDDQLHIKADENSGVKWFALADAVEASAEPWIREKIYKKLNEKLRNFKK